MDAYPEPNHPLSLFSALPLRQRSHTHTHTPNADRSLSLARSLHSARLLSASTPRHSTTHHTAHDTRTHSIHTCSRRCSTLLSLLLASSSSIARHLSPPHPSLPPPCLLLLPARLPSSTSLIDMLRVVTPSRRRASSDRPRLPTPPHTPANSRGGKKQVQASAYTSSSYCKSCTRS